MFIEGLIALLEKIDTPFPKLTVPLTKRAMQSIFQHVLMPGYWQIDMPDANQENSTMITSSGLNQATIMPQGLRNAPSTFQCTMNNIFMN